MKLELGSVDPSSFPIVRFKEIRGVLIAEQPWPTAFIVTKDFVEYGTGRQFVVFEPLSVRSFVRAVIQNWISSAVLRALHLCWRIGFVDASHGATWEAATWRWRFWAPRAGDRPRRAWL